MRKAVLLIVQFTAFSGWAQPSWSPLSREVERPHLNTLYAVGGGFHTAIRPYRRDALWSSPGADTLRPAAAWAFLDRWAGVRNGRQLRWGPMVDAAFGGEPVAGRRMNHRAGAGFWMDADVHPKLSFHVDAQAWDQRFASYLDTLVRATQVTPGQGHAHAAGASFRHYDINGHVSWDPGKYFNITAGRGRNFIGEGHRSMILSDEAYAYPYLRITTSVWRVKYMNLFTRMGDIRGAAGDPSLFRRKYTSMHYLSWNVTKRLNVGVFEAVVWNAGDSAYPRGFDINYLNPIIFYRPVEFSIGSPDNVLMGLSASYKVGRNILVYGQFVLDEFLLSEVRQGRGWYGNKQSGQFGVLMREPLGAKGLVLRTELNIVRPFMYTHLDVVQNYAHFGQGLAHPFGSGLRELVVHVDRDQGKWHYGLRLGMAWMGSDTLASHGNNIFRPESERPRNENGIPVNRGYSIGDAQKVGLFHGLLRGGYVLDPSTGTRLELSYLYRHRSAQGEEAQDTHVVQLGVVCHFRQRYHEQEVRYVLP